MALPPKDSFTSSKPSVSRKKVLLLHCAYLQPSGEDAVVAAEGALLEQHYTVLRFIRSNQEFAAQSRWRQLVTMVWNRKICRELWQFLQQQRPDIVHVHNTFLLLSPAVFRTLGRYKRQCRRQGQAVCVVMTLHNFRLGCPQATLMRPLPNGGSQLCQRCFSAGHFGPAVRFRCYRGSRIMTLAVAFMLALHKRLGTWHHNVDKFLYLNTTQKALLTRVGFPKNKFVPKPNFVADAWQHQKPHHLLPKFCPPAQTKAALRLLFVGRLSEEKGLRILLAAMRNLAKAGDLPCDLELHIAGDGPLLRELQGFMQTFGQVENTLPCSTLAAPTPKGGNCTAKLWLNYLGRLPPLAVQQAIHSCHFLVFPSIWYEGMPLTVTESLATARPVLGFRLGACAEMLAHQVNGILAPFFKDLQAERSLCLQRTHSNESLATNLSAAIAQAAALLANDSAHYAQMCRAARATFVQNYTASRNRQLLQQIYEG